MVNGKQGESGSTAQFGSSPERSYYAGRKIGRVRSVADLRARTHKLMPRFVLEYLEGGAGEEATLERERRAFGDWRAMPFTLADETCRDVSVTILDRTAPLPLAIAPTGLNGIFMRNADIALAQGAAEAGVPFIQSTMSNDRMEDVAAVRGLRHWWQLYVFGGEEIWQELVDRADRTGCEVLVLTSNAQIFGQREWDDRNRTASGFPNLPSLIDAACHPRWLATTLSRGLPEFSNVIDFVPKDKRSFFDSANWIREQMPKSLGWDDLARIRERWRKPLFLKGVLNLADVARAIDHGADGVILGGHGGRQADWAISALDLLPQARKLAGDRTALYISGGIRRGSDILKARALGADAVLTGRATLYGLCAYGVAGVSLAIELLRSEMLNELGQYGVPNLDALTSDLFVREDRLPL